MSTEDQEVSASRLADTKQAGARRRRWPAALKRELVAAATEPGASVSVIARRHDVNANQLFKWCRQMGGPAAVASVEPAQFVPVEITPVLAMASPAQALASGMIKIHLSGGIRVEIEGMADARTVSAVLGTVMAKRRRR